MSEIKTPKWFNGVVYNEGSIVQNPFSGESYELNALELSIYDFIMGAQMMCEGAFSRPDIQKDLIKALDWFRINNAKAYMVLLD